MSGHATPDRAAKKRTFFQTICSKHPQGDHTPSCIVVLSFGWKDITPKVGTRS